MKKDLSRKTKLWGLWCVNWNNAYAFFNSKGNVDTKAIKDSKGNIISIETELGRGIVEDGWCIVCNKGLETGQTICEDCKKNIKKGEEQGW